MKSYLLRVYVASGAHASSTVVAGLVEDPDTGRMWRFRDPHELWAIVSRAPPIQRAWQPAKTATDPTEGNRDEEAL